MVILETAIQSGDEKLLQSISSESYERSSEFRRIREMLGRVRINSSLSSQVAEQVFEVDPGPGELTVSFRLRDRNWIVENAKLTGFKQAATSGIPALAREYYFSDFRRMIEAGDAPKIATTTSSALMDPRLKGKKLVARAETLVTVTDVALYDHDKVVDLIYFRVRKSDKIDNRSRGWLIDASGPMLDYARRSDHSRVLIDFLSDNLKMSAEQRESAFVFGNAENADEPALPITHVDFRVDKIVTSGFKWDGATVQFLLSIDCFGASWQPPYKIALRGDRLELSTESDARFVGAPPDHRYFKSAIRDGLLTIEVKADETRRPIATFGNAVVKRHWTKPLEGGLRFVVEISAPRLMDRGR